MKALLLALAALVVCASSAFAQTAPCDLAAVTSGTVIAGQPITWGVCHDGKDTNGTVTPITGWALYDGVVRIVPTAVIADPVVSPTGFRQYTFVLTAPSAASVHTYTIAALNAIGEGAKSAPFVLTVSLAPAVPTAPIKLTGK